MQGDEGWILWPGTLSPPTSSPNTRLPLTHSFRNTKQKFDVPHQKPTYVNTWNLDNRDEWLRHLVWTRMQPMGRLSCVKTKRQVALREYLPLDKLVSCKNSLCSVIDLSCSLVASLVYWRWGVETNSSEQFFIIETNRWTYDYIRCLLTTPTCFGRLLWPSSRCRILASAIEICAANQSKIWVYKMI
jgi:hypothetical protein